MLGYRDLRPLAEVLPAKEARAIKKAFGYTACWQLLEHYPRTYTRHGGAQDISYEHEGTTVTIIGTVVRAQTITKAKTMHRVLINAGDHHIEAMFFNSRYATAMLREGAKAVFSGKLSYFRQQPQLQHPDFYIIATAAGAKGDAKQATGSLRNLAAFGDLDELLGDRDYLPIYPAKKTITSWRIMGAIHLILKTLPRVDEPLDYHPAGLPGFDAALRGVHEPPATGPEPAIHRLKYNEALGLALVMALRRMDTEQRAAPALARLEQGLQAELLANLPFPLTDGQKTALREISADLQRTHPMSRLLQGEVGSGKTIVALLAMLQAVDHRRQCALLAPTEVLAAQHARSLTATLAAAGSSATVVALTGSMGAKARQEALLAIVSGEADVVVGTHALIQDSVDFFDLGLVVVDEQHRFGVEQRDRLRSKGRDGATPHLLVMTATPIPRTIAMTVFGDLAVSTLRELPGGRRPIQTSVVPAEKPAWMTRAWERIGEEVSAGHQAYVVCPRIEGDGGVVKIHDTLQHRTFRDLTVGMLHGRMDPETKDQVMRDFAAGGIDVLVSTTVIEVGIDVANATVMLILEADRFGVSQIHQLRGRVGRGGFASLCLLHTSFALDSPQMGRLQAIAATSDGFALSELDLKVRQEGDILGTSQSGSDTKLQYLSLLTDQKIIERAIADAAELVARDPEMAMALVSDIARDNQDYLEKT